MTEQQLRAAVAEYDAEMINAIIVSDDDGCMIEWDGNTQVTWYVFDDFIRRDEGCYSQGSDVLISHAVTMRAMDAAAKAFEEALKRGISERDETIRQLRARLDEYERAPTVATVGHHYADTYRIFGTPPPIGTELIARPARKGE